MPGTCRTKQRSQSKEVVGCCWLVNNPTLKQLVAVQLQKPAQQAMPGTCRSKCRHLISELAGCLKQHLLLTSAQLVAVQLYPSKFSTPAGAE